jgi:hypothetical protein
MKQNIIKLTLTLLLLMGVTLSYTPERGLRLTTTEARAWDEEDDWWDYYDSYSEYLLDIEGPYGWGGGDNPFTSGDEGSSFYSSSYGFGGYSGGGGGFSISSDLSVKFGNLATNLGQVWNNIVLGLQGWKNLRPIYWDYGGLKISGGISISYHSIGGGSGVSGVIDDLNNPDISADDILEAYMEMINEIDEIDSWGSNNESNHNYVDSADPSMQTPEREKPSVEVEIDCTEANQEVEKIKKDLLEKETVKEVLDSLRTSAQNDSVEKGTVVDYDFKNRNSENPYSFNKQHENSANPSIVTNENPTSVNLSPYGSARTAVTMHTHPCSSSTTHINIMPPSISDFISVINFAIHIDRFQSNDGLPYPNSDRNFKGHLITGCDGSEYFLYVADIEAIKTFFNDIDGTLDNIRTRVEGKPAKFKEDTKLYKDYEYAFKQFEHPNFQQERWLYALTYALQQSNVGVELMKKNEEGEFEEQGVKRDEDKKLQPITKKCK